MGEERNQRGKGPGQDRKGRGEGREAGCRKSWLCLRGSSTAPLKVLIDISKDKTDAAVQLNQGLLSTVLYLPLLDCRLNNHVNQKRHKPAGVWVEKQTRMRNAL